MDENNNEMECYLNTNGQVYISVGDSTEDILYKGAITLDKDDVNQLIKVLVEFEKEMN